jgi:hypothetical protein
MTVCNDNDLQRISPIYCETIRDFPKINPCIDPHFWRLSPIFCHKIGAFLENQRYGNFSTEMDLCVLEIYGEYF